MAHFIILGVGFAELIFQYTKIVFYGKAYHTRFNNTAFGCEQTVKPFQKRI